MFFYGANPSKLTESDPGLSFTFNCWSFVDRDNDSFQPSSNLAEGYCRPRDIRLFVCLSICLSVRLLLWARLTRISESILCYLTRY